MAARYRAPIFRLMDKEMDADWYFGEQIGDIKSFDTTVLKNVSIVERQVWKGLTWQKNVVRLLFSKKYDKYLILGDLFTISTWVLLLLKPVVASKKKIYLWSHGWYGREGFVKKWIKRMYFGLANGTFLYGNYARRIAIDQGNNPDKLFVIHNSLDYDKHIKLRKSVSSTAIYKDHFNNEDPTLIFIGRLTKVKKLHQLIEAIAKLKCNNEKYNLILVGDGEEKANLQALANSLDLPVWFYGGCYDDDKNAELIYNADLCVSPGNVGLTAIHTMTFGTPVLTHSNFPNQMPEFEAIREGKTGAFFQEDSIDSLVKGISEWFAKPGYSRELIRNNCQEEIDNYWNPDYQISILSKLLD